MSSFVSAEEFLAALAWFEARVCQSTWVFLLCRQRHLRRSGTWTLRVCQTASFPGPARWTCSSFVERQEGKAIARLLGRAEALADLFGADLKFLPVRQDGNRVVDFLLKAGFFSCLPSILTAPSSTERTPRFRKGVLPCPSSMSAGSYPRRSRSCAAVAPPSGSRPGRAAPGGGGQGDRNPAGHPVRLGSGERPDGGLKSLARAAGAGRASPSGARPIPVSSPEVSPPLEEHP